ncbi:hypothetical protein AB0N79_39540 [Streptomyces microflavus]|uniref:hypothetical protein n=1 Tax=Streptomyces microflavus TaxID=1919 RepID=UPI00343CA4E8
MALMPLVFVHGVGNRINGHHAQLTRARDALFRRHLLSSHVRDDGGPISIHNPYWGGIASSLAWGGASIPLRAHTDAEHLGQEDADDALFEELSAAFVPSGSPLPPLLATARLGLGEAVDLLWAAALAEHPEDADELAGMSRAAVAYAAADPRPAWLESVHTDAEFLARLHQELSRFTERRTRDDGPDPADEAARWESLGGSLGWWDAVRSTGQRLGQTVVAGAGGAGAERFRGRAGKQAALFLGDIFAYLRQNTTPTGLRAADHPSASEGGKAAPGGAASGWGDIAEGIANAVTAAYAEAERGDPLVIVAHSMGGNIVYDILSGLLGRRDVQVDLLVTVGSQVGLFEELKLFSSSRGDVPGPAALHVPRPETVRRWLNVIDFSDPLAFGTEAVFDGVQDLVYRTGRVQAHSAYFLQPRFHALLAAQAAGRTP